MRGYTATLAHPRASALDLVRQVSGLDPPLVQAQLSALLPAFRAADGRVGELDPDTLRRWADWEVRFGIVSRRPVLASTFDLGLNRTAAG